MTTIQLSSKHTAGKHYALKIRTASLSKGHPITAQVPIYPFWLCYWNTFRPNSCLTTVVIVIFKSMALWFATMKSHRTE